MTRTTLVYIYKKVDIFLIQRFNIKLDIFIVSSTITKSTGGYMYPTDLSLVDTNA